MFSYLGGGQACCPESLRALFGGTLDKASEAASFIERGAGLVITGAILWT